MHQLHAARDLDRHGISANASNTKPAKLLATLVVDTGDTELTTPDKK